ncbi:MAG: ribosome small subunit-dependent GTPase A [Planctomycetaceae bacterium]|nr:ribosome small subunit-dependent GTPase A [Planctomycetaceae bacterium]
MNKRPDKTNKIRTDLRKKHQTRTRQRDLTRDYHQHGFEEQDLAYTERVSGKGELTRRRTVTGTQSDGEETGFVVLPDVDESVCSRGRVLAVHGLVSHVQAEDGDVFQCVTRGLLKTLNTDQRHIVAAGDRVWFRPGADRSGWIERVEPRVGILSRTSRGRQHILVTNVDQILIVASVAEPVLKPNLIDRFLVTAEKTHIGAVICLNKVDLVDPADLQPLAGVFGQMGYPVVFTSVTAGFGLDRVRKLLCDKETVVAGQSGVGKSSLLNAIEPGLDLAVREVSTDNEKGRHTTTTSRLLPLRHGGYVVDTPGIRQFQLWDVIAVEVAGFFRDLRPYVSHCRYPDCTHTHEADCAVKDAVADGHLDVRRYESYTRLYDGDSV